MRKEGKARVATLPVYLNALEGKGVRVATVNDYLAKRDAEWTGRIYKSLGMSVGIIVHELDDDIYRIRICSQKNVGAGSGDVQSGAGVRRIDLTQPV